MRIGLISGSQDELLKQKLIAESLGCDLVAVGTESDLLKRRETLDIVWAHGVELTTSDLEHVLVSDGELPKVQSSEGAAWLRRLKTALLVSGVEASYVVCIASSTGGVSVVKRLLSELQLQDDTAIVVVQHQDINAQASMTQQFARGSEWHVCSIESAVGVVGGACIIVTGDQVINFGAQGKILVSNQSWRGGFSPSIDHVVGSIAHRWGRDALIVYLSGLEGEGPSSARIAQRAGASIWTQSFDSMSATGMAERVTEATGPLKEVAPDALATDVAQWLKIRRKQCLL